MSWGYETLKAYAAENERRVEDLIALARKNDPFYTGAPSHLVQAKWFAEIWERFRYTTKVHTRRIHYQIVSQEEPVRMPNSMASATEYYENTEGCWIFLNDCTKHARYLKLVDPAAFIDRRNPEVILNMQPNGVPPSLSADGGGYYDLPELPDFPEMPDYNLENFMGEQRYLLEIWCEKSTMNDILEPLCQRYGANLQTGVGELSITKARECVAERIQAIGKPTRIFYISDFDPAGKSMPVAVARKIEYFLRNEFPDLDVKLEPIVLTLEQVKEYRLPRTPIKDGEKRKGKFEERYGEGAVELDALEAVRPGELERIVSEALDVYFDRNLNRRVYAVQEELEDELNGIRDDIIDAHSEEIERLRERYETIKSEFEQRIESYNDDLTALFDRIREELVEQKPDLADYPVPEPKEAVESDDVLFDSKREYFEQLGFYKKFQGNGGGK